MKFNKIYNIDCFDGFKKLAPNSVDFTFTSPPFKDVFVKGYKKSRIKKGDLTENYWPWYDKFMSELFRVTKDYIIVFNSCTNLNEIMKRYTAPFRILIWNKGFSQCTYRYELIFIYKCCANYSLNNFIWKDVFTHSTFSGPKKKHPYQNPLKLYFEIINMLPTGKSILDPCNGSGTTSLTCKLMDRPFICFENEKEYYDISIERLKYPYSNQLNLPF